jgi:hypothetical protein
VVIYIREKPQRWEVKKVKRWEVKKDFGLRRRKS